MSYLWEFTAQILRDMRRHRLRTALAIFGVLWGTFALIMLLAIGEAYYRANRSQILELAENTLIFIPGQISRSYGGRPLGQSLHVKATEAEALRQHFPSIWAISPVIYLAVPNISHGRQQIKATVAAVDADYRDIERHHPASGGRFLNAQDVRLARRVIFLNEAVTQKLFAGQPAIGESVILKQIPFTVIGSTQPGSTPAYRGHENLVFIPYTTAISLWGDADVSQLLVTPQQAEQAGALSKQIVHYLSVRFGFDPQDKSAVITYNTSEVFGFFNWFFRAMEIFLAFCGVVTLGVGGLGLSNMMFLIVTERTPEIGLRMALGAQPADILWQFLLEAGVITGLGNLLGFALAAMANTVLKYIDLPSWLGQPTLSLTVFLWALLISATIGGFASYFPAQRAAKLLPVQALTF